MILTGLWDSNPLLAVGIILFLAFCITEPLWGPWKAKAKAYDEQANQRFSDQDDQS